MAGTEHRPIRRFSTILMVAGMVLLGYVAVQCGRMYWEQRRLAQEWQKQSQIATLPGESDEEGGGSSAGTSAAVRDEHPGVTRLQIPSIALDSMVVEGTSNKALALGPGRMTSSAIPGEQGNAVISGHRDTVFRHIHELKSGDEILVQRSGRSYRFQVTGKKVVQPTDVWVLHPTPDSQLTLITCYPTYYVGPAPERLVVFSKLENESPVAKPQPSRHGAAAGASQ
jgi:LPXTG-site transpeptidase (sortase) family protein